MTMSGLNADAVAAWNAAEKRALRLTSSEALEIACKKISAAGLTVRYPFGLYKMKDTERLKKVKRDLTCGVVKNVNFHVKIAYRIANQRWPVLTKKQIDTLSSLLERPDLTPDQRKISRKTKAERRVLVLHTRFAEKRLRTVASREARKQAGLAERERIEKHNANVMAEKERKRMDDLK